MFTLPPSPSLSYLHMPSLAKSVNNAFFNRATAGSTNGYPHLVMAAQAVEFLFLLSSLRVQFHTGGCGEKKAVIIMHKLSRFLQNKFVSL
jgi:hypothetical protein